MADPRQDKKSKDKNAKLIRDKMSVLSGESIKAISESTGIARLSDDTLRFLAEDATYRLKEIVQVCSCVAEKTVFKCSILLCVIIE